MLWRRCDRGTVMRSVGRALLVVFFRVLLLAILLIAGYASAKTEMNVGDTKSTLIERYWLLLRGRISGDNTISGATAQPPRWQPHDTYYFVDICLRRQLLNECMGGMASSLKPKVKKLSDSKECSIYAAEGSTLDILRLKQGSHKPTDGVDACHQWLLQPRAMTMPHLGSYYVNAWRWFDGANSGHSGSHNFSHR